MGHHSTSAPAYELYDVQTLRSLGLDNALGLLKRCPILTLKPEQQLLHRGQERGEMYIVLDGTLAVYLVSLEDDPIAVIEPGNMVGELSMLDGEACSAHVVAKTDTRLLCADEHTFWELVRTSHEFAANLLLGLAERLRNNNHSVRENVALRQQFEQAAHYDALTNVHSRRWLDATLPRLMMRHNLSQRPLTVAMLDVDHFKAFNDRFGHPAGDVVLQKVAQAVVGVLRPTDMVARYGGEEFTVIMPDTALAGGLLAAERVRKRIAALQCKTVDGETLPPVTISIGVAQLGEGDAQIALIGRADQAMYRAKSAGRNRVES